MAKRSNLNLVLIALAFTLALNLVGFAQKPDCKKMTEDQIVDSIYAKLKPKYAKQLNHVNVRIKNGVVTVEGWATTKSIKNDIGKIAKTIACVKSVVNKLTVGVGGGCGPGEKPCGTICIPEEEKCNIRPIEDGALSTLFFLDYADSIDDSWLVCG